LPDPARIVRKKIHLMQNITRSDSRSPPPVGGRVTRAQNDSLNNTAQPPLTSGFGAVIEKEHDLQTTIEASFGPVENQPPAAIDRILRYQDRLLRANIALLEERYEALPSPERFVHWNRHRPPGTPRREPRRNEAELLPDLIARHTHLLADIDALIGAVPDGRRGDLILTEVSRNHEEMAWMLISVLNENSTALKFPGDPAAACSPRRR